MRSDGKMIKICFLATVPDALFSFMRGHIQEASKNMSVFMVSSGKRAELLSHMPGKFIEVSLERDISIAKDICSLFWLARTFLRNRFDIIHTITPKLGLLGMLGGWLVRVPCRIHTFTGQVWANKSGIKRLGLKFFDKLTVFFASHIVVDSPSQLDFLVAEGVVKKGKALVLGRGSISGVNHERFKPNEADRTRIRSQLGVPEDAVLLLFLGRLNSDKGVIDLACAFNHLARANREVYLALVGAEEDVSYAQVKEICSETSLQLCRVDFTTHPEHYMAAADILCLPSYREGFGQVIVEAAACEVPVVASRIYGITDAVDEGETGILIPAGDVGELEIALSKLIADPQLRASMGRKARKRVMDYFSEELILSLQRAMYQKVCPQ